MGAIVKLWSPQVHNHYTDGKMHLGPLHDDTLGTYPCAETLQTTGLYSTALSPSYNNKDPLSTAIRETVQATATFRHRSHTSENDPIITGLLGKLSTLHLGW